MRDNVIVYCCYVCGSKVLVDRISEEYIYKEKAGAILATLLKTGCVEIEWINGNEYKITINEKEE